MVETITERHWFFSSIYRFFFGVPEIYASLFDKIFVDELVYEDQWRIFMSTCQNDWKLTISWVSKFFDALQALLKFYHGFAGVPLTHVSHIVAPSSFPLLIVISGPAS